MHSQGQAREPSNPRVMPTTDDEIREKYLERAIRELNAFARELQACPHCPRGNLMPVGVRIVFISASTCAAGLPPTVLAWR